MKEKLKEKEKEMEKKIDLSKKEDLSIAVVHLINTEDHLAFTAMKTGKEEYLKVLDCIRELRKKLMKKLVTNVEGEMWCLPPNMIVFSNFSGKKMEDLKVGELVLTHNGQFMPIVKVFKRQYNGELIKIIPYYTNIPIFITPEHSLLCAQNVRIKQKTLWRKKFKNPNITWKKAKDLTHLDFLIFPRHKNSLKIKKLKISYSWINKSTFKRPKKFKQEKELLITNELMELIGLYISEGCISESRAYFKKEKRFMKTSYVSWTFGAKEFKLAEKVLKYLKTIFDVSAKINERKDKNLLEITSGKKLLIKFFEQFGTKSYNKNLPEWVMYLPKEKFLFLLKGLIEGDGHVGKFNLSYTTFSETLAYQLRMILFKHGILHSLSKRNIRNGKICNRIIKAHYPAYEIRISGDSAREVCKFVNFNYFGGKKTSGNFGYVLKKYIMIPIKKIEKESYNGVVLNFAVLYDESYTTISGVVHNCVNKHLLAATMRLLEVGEKCIGNNDKEAKEFFKDAFDVYGLFWFLQKLGEKSASEKTGKKASKV